MRGAFILLCCTGCSLYFGEGSQREESRTGTVPPDACGQATEPDAKTCPAPGTYAEIFYPLDGATNVPTPVPISLHYFIPNTLDGKGMYITDSSGQQLPVDYNPDCSIPPPAIQLNQDISFTECLNLPPDQEFTYHIWITCYDASGGHEIATSTFRTAGAE